ncbi:hypothetical protein J6590_029203 [Homalodisca vitripennis]|nr:hypothetical protein J6590_029203 [Homalodisca vitripennis]
MWLDDLPDLRMLSSKSSKRPNKSVFSLGGGKQTQRGNTSNSTGGKDMPERRLKWHVRRQVQSLPSEDVDDR